MFAHFRQLYCSALAPVLAHPRVSLWLITRAVRRPYSHIYSPDGSVLYMARYWLFNPYPSAHSKARGHWFWSRLPSIRLHRIMREDCDRHLHDHPWNARSFVLRGWYNEERPASWDFCSCDPRSEFRRLAGTSTPLLHGQYHRISCVPSSGVWTLFVTYRYRGTWGFLVNGRKIPWREYLHPETTGHGG